MQRLTSPGRESPADRDVRLAKVSRSAITETK